MSFLRTLGRLASGFAQSRLEDAVLGDRSHVVRRDLRTGETTTGTRRTGGLLGEPDYDGDGRSSLHDRQRAEAEGGFNAHGMAGMVAGLASAAREAGGVGAFVDNIKDHAKGALDEHKARLLIQAMILAARADGEIDADERARIMEHLGDAEPEERAFVEAEMEGGTSLDAFLASVPPDPAFRGQVYALSLMAIEVDTPEEATHMQALADGLGLSDADIAEAAATLGQG